MPPTVKEYVVYHPAGFPVTVVGRTRAETLLDRGYMTEAPDNAPKTGGELREGAIFANGRVVSESHVRARAGRPAPTRRAGLFGERDRDERQEEPLAAGAQAGGGASGSTGTPAEIASGDYTATAAPADVDYQALPKARLQELLRERGRDDSEASKAELVARLRAEI